MEKKCYVSDSGCGMAVGASQFWAADLLFFLLLFFYFLNDISIYITVNWTRGATSVRCAFCIG